MNICPKGEELLQAFGKATALLESFSNDENKSGSVDELSQAFAAKMLIVELGELKEDLNEIVADESLSRQTLIRFYDWTIARFNAYILMMQKENPEAGHPDKEIAHAAYVAHLVTIGDIQNIAIKEFNLRLQSAAANKKFAKEILKPTRAKWNFPALDVWLVSIWPLVTAYDWTYKDVWKVAAEKREFGLKELKLFDEMESFVHHCKYLDLRLSEKASKAKGAETLTARKKLPFLAKVALDCPAILSKNSFFSKK